MIITWRLAVRLSVRPIRLCNRAIGQFILCALQSLIQSRLCCIIVLSMFIRVVRLISRMARSLVPLSRER